MASAESVAFENRQKHALAGTDGVAKRELKFIFIAALAIGAEVTVDALAVTAVTVAAEAATTAAVEVTAVVVVDTIAEVTVEAVVEASVEAAADAAADAATDAAADAAADGAADAAADGAADGAEDVVESLQNVVDEFGETAFEHVEETISESEESCGGLFSFVFCNDIEDAVDGADESADASDGADESADAPEESDCETEEDDDEVENCEEEGPLSGAARLSLHRKLMEKSSETAESMGAVSGGRHLSRYFINSEEFDSFMKDLQDRIGSGERVSKNAVNNWFKEQVEKPECSIPGRNAKPYWEEWESGEKFEDVDKFEISDPKYSLDRLGYWNDVEPAAEAPLEPVSSDVLVSVKDVATTSVALGGILGVFIIVGSLKPGDSDNVGTAATGTSHTSTQITPPPDYHCYRGSACTTYDWRLLTATCSDMPAWFDVAGRGCSWYTATDSEGRAVCKDGAVLSDGVDMGARPGVTRADVAVSWPGTSGYGAQYACCSCGGGVCTDRPLWDGSPWTDKFGSTCDVYARKDSKGQARCAGGRVLVKGLPGALPDTTLQAISTEWNRPGEPGADQACCVCGAKRHITKAAEDRFEEMCAADPANVGINPASTLTDGGQSVAGPGACGEDTRLHCQQGTSGPCYTFGVKDGETLDAASLENFFEECGELEGNESLDVRTALGATGQTVAGTGACKAVEYHCMQGRAGSCHTVSTAQWPMKKWGGSDDPKNLTSDLAGFLEFCGSWDENAGLDVTAELGITGQFIGGLGACGEQTGTMHCYAGVHGECAEFDSTTDYPQGSWDETKYPGLTPDLAGFVQYCANSHENRKDYLSPENITQAIAASSGQTVAGMGSCGPPARAHCQDGLGGGCITIKVTPRGPAGSASEGTYRKALAMCKSRPANARFSSAQLTSTPGRTGQPIFGPGACIRSAGTPYVPARVVLPAPPPRPLEQPPNAWRKDESGTSLRLIQVAVGNGVELGLDANNVVYYRNWATPADASSAWQKALNQVAMQSVAVGGLSGDFWVGFGMDKQLYYRDSSSGEWSEQLESLAWVDDVQVAASGLGKQSVWVVDGYAGGTPWFMGEGAKESDSSARATRIAVGGLHQSNAIAWIIGKSSYVYRNENDGLKSFTLLDETFQFSDLAVGGDSGDKLYAVDSKGVVYFRVGKAGAWQELVGTQRAIKQVSVGGHSGERILAIGTDGSVLSRRAAAGGCNTCTCASWDGSAYHDCSQGDSPSRGYGPFSCYDIATTGGVLQHRPKPKWAPGGNGGSCGTPLGCIPCACKIAGISPTWGFGFRDCSTTMSYGEHKGTCFLPETTGGVLTRNDDGSKWGCVACTCNSNNGGYNGEYTDCQLASDGGPSAFGPFSCFDPQSTDGTYTFKHHGSCSVDEETDGPECPAPSGCIACTCTTKGDDHTDCKIAPESEQTSASMMSCFDPLSTQFKVTFSHPGPCFKPPPSPPPPPPPPKYGSCSDKPLATADSNGNTVWRDRFGWTCDRYADTNPLTGRARCAAGKLLVAGDPNALPDTTLAAVETAWNRPGEDGAASACCACGGGINPIGLWGCVPCSCNSNDGGWGGSYTDCSGDTYGKYGPFSCWDPRGSDDGEYRYKHHGVCAGGSDKTDGAASGCVGCSCASLDAATGEYSDCVSYADALQNKEKGGTDPGHGPLACYNPGSTNGVLTPRRTTVPGAVSESCLPKPAGCIACSCLARAQDQSTTAAFTGTVCVCVRARGGVGGGVGWAFGSKLFGANSAALTR